MSKMETKKTTWTVSPTRKKVIILILSDECHTGSATQAEVGKKRFKVSRKQAGNKKRQRQNNKD